MADDLVQRLESARDFPNNTCPSSRHAQMIGESLVNGHLLTEELEHCGNSILSTVAALYETRTALARKDAEIAELRQWRFDTCERLGLCCAAGATWTPKDVFDLVRAEESKLTANRDEWRQRAERAEARVREAPVGELELVAGDHVFSAATTAHWEAANMLIGKRVALVLLDTEEAK